MAGLEAIPNSPIEKLFSRLSLGKMAPVKEPVSPPTLDVNEFRELLNALPSELPPDADMVIIEDFAEQFKRIKYYEKYPEKITGLQSVGGIRQVLAPYRAKLLQASIALHNATHVEQMTVLSAQEAEVAVRGMTQLVQHEKERQAYQHTRAGTKFQRSGQVAKPADSIQARRQQSNPIIALSRQNLAKLIHALREAGRDSFLRDDERALYHFMLYRADIRCQHATPSFHPIANGGSLDSCTERQRHDQDYESSFSTKGNLTKLGNGGFVFFRVYGQGNNGQATRYGGAKCYLDIAAFEQTGWVSLHDQLLPVSYGHHEYMMHGKEHVRWLKTHAVQSPNNKALHDGMTYIYRTQPLCGSRTETHKSFGAMPGHHVDRRLFTEEIFYGPMIRDGIALSLLRELRFLDACGYRDIFMRNFQQANSTERQILFAKLLKDCFRIEAKYPVAMRFNRQANGQLSVTNRQAGQAVALMLENPHGDGRYDQNGQVVGPNMYFANLKEQLEKIRPHIRFDDEKRQEYFRLKLIVDYVGQHVGDISYMEKSIIILAHFREYLDEMQSVDTLMDYEIEQLKIIVCMKNTYLADIFTEEEFVDDILDIFTDSQADLFIEYEDLFAFHGRHLDNDIDDIVDMLDHEEFLSRVGSDSYYSEIFEREDDLSSLFALYKKGQDKTGRPDLEFYLRTAADLSDFVVEYFEDMTTVQIKYAYEHGADYHFIIETLSESERMLYAARHEGGEDFYCATDYDSESEDHCLVRCSY